MDTTIPTARQIAKVQSALASDPTLETTKKINIVKPSGQIIAVPELAVAVAVYMLGNNSDPAKERSSALVELAKSLAKGKVYKDYLPENGSLILRGPGRRRTASSKNPVSAVAPEAPKRRGRPRKNPVLVMPAPEAPKRRGRPRQHPVVETGAVAPEAPKRRGRPRKNPVPAGPAPAAPAAPKRRGRPRKHAAEPGTTATVTRNPQLEGLCSVFAAIAANVIVVQQMLEVHDANRPGCERRKRLVDDLAAEIIKETNKSNAAAAPA